MEFHRLPAPISRVMSEFFQVIFLPRVLCPCCPFPQEWFPFRMRSRLAGIKRLCCHRQRFFKQTIWARFPGDTTITVGAWMVLKTPLDSPGSMLVDRHQKLTAASTSSCRSGNWVVNFRTSHHFPIKAVEWDCRAREKAISVKAPVCEDFLLWCLLQSLSCNNLSFPKHL